MYIKERTTSKNSNKNYESNTNNIDDNFKIINYNCNNLYLLYNKKIINDK